MRTLQGCNFVCNLTGDWRGAIIGKTAGFGEWCVAPSGEFTKASRFACGPIGWPQIGFPAQPNSFYQAVANFLATAFLLVLQSKLNHCLLDKTKGFRYTRNTQHY